MTITGTVKSLDGSTLVLTTADGTETTIDVSGSTYHAQSPATSTDVTAGTEVSVSVDGVRWDAPPRCQRRSGREHSPGSGSDHGHRRDDHVQVGELLVRSAPPARPCRGAAPGPGLPRARRRRGDSRHVPRDRPACPSPGRPSLGLPRPSPARRRLPACPAQPGPASRACRRRGDDSRSSGAPVTAQRRLSGADRLVVAAGSYGGPVVVDLQAPSPPRKPHKPQVSSQWSTPGRHPPLATCATEERRHGKHQPGTPDCGSAA